MTGHDHDSDHAHGSEGDADHAHDHAHGEEGGPKHELDPARYAGLSGWEIRTVSDCVHELVASLERARFEELIETSARNIARRVTLKGFRPGKVPVTRVKQLFAEDIHREGIEKLVNDTWNEAVQEKKLRPVAPPKVTELSARPGERVLFTARFEMLPEIEVSGIGSLDIAPRTVRVTDEDVHAEVENIRLMRSRLVPSEAAEAGPGAFAELTLMRWPHGQPAEGEPAESREGLVVEIGNERNLPELDKTLVGMRPGEMRDFEADVPAGPDAPPARTAFRVLLKDLRRRELPELDLDLVNSLGIGQFADLEAFRAEVKRRLVENRTEMARREQEAEAMEKLLARNEFGVPPSLIETEAEARLKRGVENLVRRGVNVEDAPIDWQTEIRRLRELAEKDLRADWLLELAARAKGVQVSDADVEKEIEAMAREREQPPAAVRAALEKSKEINNLRSSLRRRRTLDLLRSDATILVE